MAEEPTILVVDDSASMRKMVTFTLQEAGFKTLEAQDGEEAVKLATTGQPVNLVLSDVNMPRMDGISLIRHLRGLPNYKYVPILMLTTEASLQRRQEGKAAGATGWLVKPFNPQQLIATIKRVLSL